jgi:hypothetical protein
LFKKHSSGGGVQEDEKEPSLTYMGGLARTVLHAGKLKERRAAELRADPYDAARMQARVDG